MPVCYSDQDLIERFEEIAAIRQFDGLTSAELDAMTDEESAAWRRKCEQAAYFDLRRIIGPGVALPAKIKRLASKFTPTD